MRRPVPLILLGLLVILQMQLWFGRGSIPDVWRLRQQYQQQLDTNTRSEQDIARLRAELRDLRDGLEMVEERARSEIGMVKPNEIFVQLAKSSQ
ncbi:MAG: septum formation initiator family protein [Burkholderiales bacterium]|jgi:cell division protein FtsB|nr:septum formation initiator family protein [Burkholderiales bacterium]NDG14974.1 septation ring formation regulator EzrA [Betaproteobacteria bacterium]